MGFDYAGKIQALLATAEDMARRALEPHACPTCTEGVTDHVGDLVKSASSYRAKAETLMREYRIAEEQAISREIAGHEPTQAKIRLYTGWSPLSSWYSRAFMSVAQHCGVAYTLLSDNGLVAGVVGYEGDVRYAEFLWTAASLMFSTRIDPRWDPSLSQAENVYRLRSSGMRRKDVAYAAGRDGNKASDRSWVQRVYLRECEKRGETPGAAGLGHDADSYRAAYAESFVVTLARRLRDARDAVDSQSGGLVLHGRAERVREAFYRVYPHLRPSDTPRATSEPCAKCAKNKTGSCREHPRMVVRQSDIKRWNRIQHSPGNAAGRRAAEGVVIERGSTRTGRIEG